MRRPVVGLDFRPALIGNSGIGRYTRELVRALPEFCGELDLRLFAVFKKDVGPRRVPSGCEAFRLVEGRFPGRALNWLGALRLLSVESFTGPLDLMQLTDYVALPLRTKRRIATIHDLSFLREPRWYEEGSRRRIEKVTRRLIAEASIVTTDSDASKRDLIEFCGLREDRIVVAPLGADQRFADLPEAPNGPPRLLFCGTLEPRKNHLRLLEAFDLLRAEEPDAELTVVGRRGWLDGQIVAALEARADRGVRWLREACDNAMLEAMALANIVVYPSLWEGFGLPLLEGMTAGRAVLSSARGSMAEMVGRAGLLVDPESVSAIAEGLIELARDPGLRLRLGLEAQERAAQFSWRRCAELTAGAWHRLLEEGT